jgi:hypothetical protein
MKKYIIGVVRDISIIDPMPEDFNYYLYTIKNGMAFHPLKAGAMTFMNAEKASEVLQEVKMVCPNSKLIEIVE